LQVILTFFLSLDLSSHFQPRAQLAAQKVENMLL
jgi:hypothetical protein